MPEKYRSSIEDQARQVTDCLNKWIDKDTKFIFNPTGEWNAVNSCSAADSELPAAKLVVQLYGGYPGAQLGGGSIVNKTPEKVDCSAAFGALCGKKYRLFPFGDKMLGTARLCHRYC